KNNGLNHAAKQWGNTTIACRTPHEDTRPTIPASPEAHDSLLSHRLKLMPWFTTCFICDWFVRAVVHDRANFHYNFDDHRNPLSKEG
ncbi:hypothetical protein V1478_000197, partial [Vespula squamosa]